MAKKKNRSALKKLLLIILLIAVFTFTITAFLYKSGSRLVFTENQLETSDWKTFSSSKYKFSFRYPADLTTNVPAPSGDFEIEGALNLNGNKKPAVELMLNVFSVDGTTLQLQRNTFHYPGSTSFESQIEIDGVKSYKFSNPSSSNQTLLFERNGYIYSISKESSMSDKTFNEIISSFRFSR